MRQRKEKDIEEIVKENFILKTKVKHLTNDLRLTREENETSTENYFELYSNMEKKVEERTRELKELQKQFQQAQSWRPLEPWQAGLRITLTTFL